MTDAAPDGPAAVVGQRVVVTDRVRALRILAVCALTSYWMWRGRYEWLLYSAVLVALQVRVVKQPPSVVSATGIIRPWRRRSYVDWNEVESVAPPDPGRRGCMLNLANGKAFHYLIFLPIKLWSSQLSAARRLGLPHFRADPARQIDPGAISRSKPT